MIEIPLMPNASTSVIPIKDTVIEDQQATRNEDNLNLNRYSPSPSSVNHLYTRIGTGNDKIRTVNTPTTVTQFTNISINGNDFHTEINTCNSISQKYKLIVQPKAYRTHQKLEILFKNIHLPIIVK